MNTFDFMQATISHNLKDPHSKALEPDCLSHRLAITTQPPEGEGWVGGHNCIDIKLFFYGTGFRLELPPYLNGHFVKSEGSDYV